MPKRRQRVVAVSLPASSPFNAGTSTSQANAMPPRVPITLSRCSHLLRKTRIVTRFSLLLRLFYPQPPRQINRREGRQYVGDRLAPQLLLRRAGAKEQV